MRLIGLTGYAGSGKDTVRALLERNHGALGMAFADPLRRMLRPLLAAVGAEAYMDTRELKEQVIPDLGFSYRMLAQTLGTEWGRAAVDSDFWVRILAARVDQRWLASDQIVVVSDVRFSNEAAWVRSRGGSVWRVERPDVAPVRDHASEAFIERIGADAVIKNDGPLDALPGIIAAALM